MSSSKYDDEPLSGEVIRPEDNRVPVVRALFATLSRFAFKNFWERKKLASMREVFKEEKELFKEIDEHQRSFNRLKNMRRILRDDDAALEANAIASENRLAEEKRKEAARRRDDLLFEQNKAYEEAQSRMRNEYELKIKEAEYKKRLHPLEKEVAGFESEEEPPKKRRAASTTELFKEKDKIDKEYAKREAAINDSNSSKEKKTSDKKVLDRWREEQYERIEKLFGRGDKTR